MNSVFENRHTICLAFSSHLAAMRGAYGLSQNDLGILLGKSRQAISLIERGLLVISWDSLLAVLFVFERLDASRIPFVLGFLKEFGFAHPSLNDFVADR